MRFLAARALLVLGGLCICAGAGTVLYAEYQQRYSRRVWRETVVDSVPVIYQNLPPGVVARMTFTRQEREVFVFRDDDPDNLRKGPVWLRVTKTFGEGGNTVVAGHRDTHFRFLKDARTGDQLSVEDGSSQRMYRITQIRIVKPTDRSLLAPADKKILTLVTCYPFHLIGRATRRMIIRAELVSQLSAADRIN